MPTSAPPLEMLLVFACVATLLALWPRTSSDRSIPRRRRIQASTPRMGARNAAKPPWVHEEVLRLKALMPTYGCRKVSVVFNQLRQHRRKVTVGKTFVATVLRLRQHEIAAVRREIQHQRPKTMSPNIIWALDLTYLGDRDSKRTVLGILDHGSRACLTLRDMRDKSSVAILRVVLDAIERFGKPKYIRTDNEPVFTSTLFRLGLSLLGVRHQLTAPFAPWQNGRVERFFKTFKEAVRPWPVWLAAEPQGDLAPLSALVQSNTPASASRRTYSCPAMEWPRTGSIERGFLLLGMGWALDRILLPP